MQAMIQAIPKPVANPNPNVPNYSNPDPNSNFKTKPIP